MLKLDEELDEQLSEEEPVLRETVPKGDDNAMVIREFIIHPFFAELNLRRKDSGLFREFLQRPFNYSGFHFYDIVGTREELTLFVKKNLRWAVIRALPALVFRKNRRPDETEENGGENGRVDYRARRQSLSRARSIASGLLLT
jgi:hypothetical protein